MAFYEKEKKEKMQENIDYVICPICNKKLKQINFKHMKMHGFENTQEFLLNFPNQLLICQNTLTRRGKSISKSKMGHIVTIETKEKQSKSHMGNKRSKESIEKQIKTSTKNWKKLKDKPHILERNEKISKKLKLPRKNIVCKECGKIFNEKITSKKQFCSTKCFGKNKRGKSAYNKGKKLEEIVGIKKAIILKEKMRKLRLSQIAKNNNGKMQPNYNPSTIPILAEFDRINNTNGRYAIYGGGEKEILGYFVDYFNKDLKIIIEVDEKHHFNKSGKLREKDITRQKEIQRFYPDFQFLRFKEDEIEKILKVELNKYA